MISGRLLPRLVLAYGLNDTMEEMMQCKISTRMIFKFYLPDNALLERRTILVIGIGHSRGTVIPTPRILQIQLLTESREEWVCFHKTSGPSHCIPPLLGGHEPRHNVELLPCIPGIMIRLNPGTTAFRTITMLILLFGAFGRSQERQRVAT